MARYVPGPSAGTVRTYVPKSFGNRDDPLPIEVDLKIPTEAERRAMVARSEAFLDAKTGRIKVDLENSRELKDYAIRNFVSGVRNYTANTGKPITDGSELADHGESELILEIYPMILRPMSLLEEEKKSSEQPSGSKSSEGDGSSTRTENATAPPLSD